MKREKTELSEIMLVGFSARTNNKNEMNPELSKIGQLAGNYWSNQLAQAIQHRTNPGVTYAVYTDYDSDEHGDYTYFIGEAVDSLAGQNLSQFTTVTIPKSHYQKFTTDPGKMPNVVIAAWQSIWAMRANQLGGKRRYVADFEIYDDRAGDPNNTIVDIYIGINEK